MWAGRPLSGPRLRRPVHTACERYREVVCHQLLYTDWVSDESSSTNRVNLDPSVLPAVAVDNLSKLAAKPVLGVVERDWSVGVDDMLEVNHGSRCGRCRKSYSQRHGRCDAEKEVSRSRSSNLCDRPTLRLALDVRT